MPDERSSLSTAPARRRRWGLRTLGCLVVAISAIVVAAIQGFHTPGTLGCVVLGLIGAIYCTVRGIRDLVDLEWYRRRLADQHATRE